MPKTILTRCPNHLNWLLSMWRSSGSTLNLSRMTELLTVSLRESPATLQRKLISAAYHHYPQLVTIGEGWNKDRLVPFSDWEPWSQIYRCWFSSLPLHTLLQTSLVRAEDPHPMAPGGPCHPQKAETKSWHHQTGGVRILKKKKGKIKMYFRFDTHVYFFLVNTGIKSEIHFYFSIFLCEW